MDYKKSKELLLQAKVLVLEDARLILDLWQDTPGSYYDLLSVPDASVFLEKYAGFNKMTALHEFVPVERRVPSPRIAAKFFACHDEEISLRFIRITTETAFRNMAENEVCAWPYMTELCVDCLSLEIIRWLIADKHYIFNFACDTQGKLYDIMYKKVDTELGEESDLALNSMNSAAWAEKAAGEKISSVQGMSIMSQYLWSQRGVCGRGDALTRKQALRFSYDVEVIERKIYQQAVHH